MIKLQFCGDTDMEDWMANLTYGKNQFHVDVSG